MACHRCRFATNTMKSSQGFIGKTRSSIRCHRYAKDDKGERIWDGIIMEGPYSWRPPTYWFGGKFPQSRGSSAEEGDNEHVPPLESLKKFIPADKLWPINDTWYFHAGAGVAGTDTLTTIQRAVDRRYGPSANVEEFRRARRNWLITKTPARNLKISPRRVGPTTK